MTNKELYQHYRRRFSKCRNIINDINQKHKWNTIVPLFIYYDDKLKTIHTEIGRSNSVGGNYKSQIEEAIKPERRNVGNYKSKLK